jgi:Ca2+-binding RTX toxin-like protein
MMLLVAACGGGGGGDEAPSADTTPVVPAKATTPETPTQNPMEKGSVSPETPTPPPSPLVPLQLKATGPGLMFLGTTNTDDRASFEPSPKPVYVDLTKKTSRGGYAEKAVLDEIEHLVGSPHDDSLIGDEKPNVLEGGAGADDLDGRQNSDTASYAGSTHGVDVNLETGFATGGHADGDMLTDIENLIGSDFNDFLTGNAGPNRLDGGAGVNSTDYVRSLVGVTIDLASGEGSGGHAQGDELINIHIVIGSTFNDILRGSDDANELFGAKGHDELYGGAGSDRLYGGEGEDKLFGGSGSDWLFGGGGVDILYGGADADFMDGGAHWDTLYGEGGNDTMYGREGNDTLYGGVGNDRLYGGEDHDLLFGDRGEDVLRGEFGNDLLYGGLGEDILYGGSDDDFLSGGENNDTLDGGDGVDTLFGGAGEDIFVLHHEFSDVAHRDDVADFTSGDRILVNTRSGRETSLAALREALNIDWTQSSDFSNSTSSNQSRLDDTLVYSRGADRTFGTRDDILLMVLEDYTEELTVADFFIV